MNFKLILGCLLTAALLPLSAQAGPNKQPSAIVAAELARKSQPHVGKPIPNPLATAVYSASTTGGPTYDRALETCDFLSGVGIGVNYHIQEFSVGTTGVHSVSSVQNKFDGFIFVYEGTFNPGSALTNCLAGDDDGTGGIGTSDISSVNLTAGTNYVLVTTGFEPVDSGEFTNTITGPGAINLAAPGPDLGITKTTPDGVITGGNYTYQLVANNAGPSDATGVAVTDVLPAGVNFVSSSCGATNAAGTVTWTIGALANGANASCTLTVALAGASCVAVSNTASIDGAEGDANPGNNSSTSANGGGNAVLDPSFEGGSPSAIWTEESTNFGTPLCTIAGCGTGTGTGPRTGDWWSWFGGIDTAEVGAVEQSLTIPSGATAITFWVEFPICANKTDFVRLTIDGTQVWREDGTSARCNIVGYSQVTVPLTAGQANGAAHALRFESTTSGAPTGSNFFLDDIAIASPPLCAAPANADLSITYVNSTVGASTLGSTVTFNVTVANAGPGAAAGVVATVNVPLNVSSISNTCSATAVGNTLTWNIGALASGATVNCSISGTIARTGSSTATASVTATSPTDPVLTNNSAVAGLVVAFALPFSSPFGLLLLLAGVGVLGIWATRRH